MNDNSLTLIKNFIWRDRPPYIAKTGLELTILLPLPQSAAYLSATCLQPLLPIRLCQLLVCHLLRLSVCLSTACLSPNSLSLFHSYKLTGEL